MLIDLAMGNFTPEMLASRSQTLPRSRLQRRRFPRYFLAHLRVMRRYQRCPANAVARHLRR